MNHRVKDGRNHEYQDLNDSASIPDTAIPIKQHNWTSWLETESS